MDPSEGHWPRLYPKECPARTSIRVMSLCVCFSRELFFKKTLEYIIIYRIFIFVVVFLEFIYIILLVLYDDLQHQASEYQICEIAASICKEMNSTISDSASGNLLRKMASLHKTGHGNRVFPEFEKAGLTVNIPETYVDIGIKHPILKFRDVVSCLSRMGKMTLLVKDDTLHLYDLFWARFQKLSPHHPIFERTLEQRKCTIPLLLHADEGTSQKKRGVMVISLQPIVGDGTSKGGRQLNYIGHSLTTRFLYSVIMAKYYRKPHGNRLKALVSMLADEKKDLFHHPCKVAKTCMKQTTFYFIFLCFGSSSQPCISTHRDANRKTSRKEKPGDAS